MINFPNAPATLSSEVYEHLMECCRAVASNGLGFTADNPLVGCLLIQEVPLSPSPHYLKNRAFKILASGFHPYFGANHAERECLNNFQTHFEASQSLLNDKNSNFTLVVNLEPCSHHGKTGPCCELIAQFPGIRRVVYGLQDTHLKVNGSGLEYLRQKGVEVIGPIQERQNRKFNYRFLSRQKNPERPFYCLKWAQTPKGFLGVSQNNQEVQHRRLLITAPDAEWYLKELRNQFAAILVGVGTLVLDNPKLLCTKSFLPQNNVASRFSFLNQFRRLVWDPQNKFLTQAHLQKSESEWQILQNGSREQFPITFLVKQEFCSSKSQKLAEKWAVSILSYSNLQELQKKLLQLGLYHILVEGGAHTHQLFFKQGWLDELQIIQSHDNDLDIHIDAALSSTNNAWIGNAKKQLVLGEQKKIGQKDEVQVFFKKDLL